MYCHACFDPISHFRQLIEPLLHSLHRLHLYFPVAEFLTKISNLFLTTYNQLFMRLDMNLNRMSDLRKKAQEFLALVGGDYDLARNLIALAATNQD
ncbi:hypothetical protein Rcae01_06070 [Novipirellula caenicola]|uniref:Uncharacterized protein n=1 Tax=Novipirellula caenicola TaxID=1536901 RepID=A0ABP9W0Q5_9BACT